MSQPHAARVLWRGLSCTQLTLPQGDSVRVSDFGAQVLSWTARGHERLFCSERTVLDGSAALRGVVSMVQTQDFSVGQTAAMAVLNCLRRP